MHQSQQQAIFLPGGMAAISACERRDPTGQVEDSVTWYQCCQDGMANSTGQIYTTVIAETFRKGIGRKGAEEWLWF